MRIVRATIAGSGLLLAATLVAAPRIPALAATPQQWQLTAPASGLPPVTATVRLDPSGRLSLEVRRANATVLQPSALGIRTTSGDLSTGLTFSRRTDAHVTDHYPTAAGKRRDHTVDANATTLRFTKGSSRLDVVFRVSADGLGYRYVVRRTG